MATARRSRRGSIRGSGWDTYARPVPGNVLAAIEELGLKVDRVTGDEIHLRCPQHFNRVGKEDRHPSFSVNIESGVFGCYSCGYRGVFVQLVVDTLDVEWEEAVAWVRKRGGIERVRASLGLSIDQLDTPTYSTEIDTTKVINEASLALFVDPPDSALEARGIAPEAAALYGIRWDDQRRMWITPIRDPDTNKLLGWQEKNARYFRNRPYDVKKGNTVFGLDTLVEGHPAVLMESPLDGPSLWTSGIPNGLSSYGAAVTDRQMELIREETDELIVALDNDRDGRINGSILRERWGRKFRMKFWDYSNTKAKDPGDQTESEKWWSYEHAYSSILATF